ncbi:MAG: Lin0512 family protein [Chloroflexota bacterium]
MALKRVLLEMGMGTDIRGGDNTKAAVRALRDALWRNSVSVTGALGLDADAMHVAVTIGAPQPDTVDRQQVLDVLPHGTGEVEVKLGGLEIPTASGDDRTIIANAAAVVYVDIPEPGGHGPAAREG